MVSAGLCFSNKFLKIKIPGYGKYVNKKWGEEEENNLSETLCCYGKAGLWELPCLNQDWQCLCYTAEIIMFGAQNWSPKRETRKGSRETRRTGIGHVEMKKTLKSVSLRREKPTGLKSSREFKKGEHRSRKLGSFFMEKVNKLI